jgi:phenol hydroxylase P0 protein
VQSHQLPVPKPEFDVERRYVRFRDVRADGFVEFAFAIGDPELSVELVMLLEDYKTFCRAQGVIFLTREQAVVLDSEQSKWRYGYPGLEE